jgi:hypothetical protein
VIPRLRPLLLTAAAVSFLAGPLGAQEARRTHRTSPHVEIVVVARVETPPRRRVHANGREFEEFDVMLLSSAPSPDQGRGADRELPVEGGRRVHVVHDLSCGGGWVDLAAGDRVELKGEYVRATGGGKNVLHFTHPTTGECGVADGHPDGYLRRR